ncbi:MAG: hypothetical protein DBY32_11345 [Phascolarctobacterium sp.]|nr:MAG: hypothetical protein DBY32_11345 [Phascolarctobacterium sp.]
MRRLHFRNRKETLYIQVLCADSGTNDLERYYRLCRQQGSIDTGCHYFIDDFGNLSVDRELSAVAGWGNTDSDTSIYIFVQSKTGKPNDSQDFTLNKLLRELQKIYPDALIINRKG